MTIEVQPVPELVLASDFPTLADRPAGTYNQKAAAWAASENAMATRLHEIATVTKTNADASQEAAEALNDPAVQEVVENIDTVKAVDANKANIDTVAASKASIDAAAGNADNINKVAAIDAHVSAVAAIDTDVSAVAAIDADVSTVAAVTAGVSAVAAIVTEVSAVAAIDAEVAAVAFIDEDVSAAAANAANITAVANNATNINAVNANKANIDAVASNKANIDTVAADTLAVSMVAANMVSVQSADANMAAIIAAPGAASAAAASAGEAEGFKDTAEAAAAAAQAAAGLPAIAGKAGAALVVNEAETGVKYALPLSAPAITGPVSIEPNAEQSYTITNHSSFADYFVQISDGTVSMSGATITVTAPSEPGDVTLTVTVNGLPTAFSIEVLSPYIETPAPTPANLLDPFEGGYYMGLYWDQLLQSPTETEIATGAKTFSVPGMTVPMTYIGHQLEVRSRANPANKMIATVTAASLSAKTIDMNVTSVEGSGTFSDWSIMTQYRSIDAPKSSGEFASIRLKNANTALPVECQTLTDGWRATLAMVAAGDATEYPAAHAVRALTIGGFDDWHIPARDVLELRWRNGKPVTNDNYITGTRAFSAIDYETNGNYGDQSGDARGLNRNSVPAGAAYTATVPAQTAVALFQQGGAEAYEFGSAYYWSCTEYSETVAWYQYWSSSYPGYQGSHLKTNYWRLRAVRRSII